MSDHKREEKSTIEEYRVKRKLTFNSVLLMISIAVVIVIILVLTEEQKMMHRMDVIEQRINVVEKMNGFQINQQKLISIVNILNQKVNNLENNNEVNDISQ